MLCTFYGLLFFHYKYILSIFSANKSELEHAF